MAAPRDCKAYRREPRHRPDAGRNESGAPQRCRPDVLADRMYWQTDRTMDVMALNPADMPDEPLLVFLAPRALADDLPWSLLSAEEQDRWTRFRHPADRERFLVAHGLKRLVLSTLLGRPAAALTFGNNNSGKPFVVKSDMQFNLTHSGDWIALACRRSAAVGIDVEQPPKASNSLPASLLFHPDDEIPEYAASDMDRFFVAWTLKEAMAKCCGLGLGLAFPDLQLATTTPGHYRGRHATGIWYGQHARLADGTHMAVAGDTAWRSVAVILMK